MNETAPPVGTDITTTVNPMGMTVVLALLAFLVAIGTAIVLQWCLQRIPKEHRRIEPIMAWLVIVPFFQLLWNFVLFPKVAKSYQDYFRSVGGDTVGDCGYGLAWTYSIVALLAVVSGLLPSAVLTLFLFAGALVLLVLVGGRFFFLRRKLPGEADTEAEY